jgi:hypothetical protein
MGGKAMTHEQRVKNAIADLIQGFPPRRLTASECVASRNGNIVKIEPIKDLLGLLEPPRFEDEVDEHDRVMATTFRHGPLSGEAECDEWIAATIRKLPRGALAKLYRILYEGEGMRIDAAKLEEAKWLKSLKK